MSAARALQDGLTTAILADAKSARLYMFGVYFGFPECCIQQFVAEFDQVSAGSARKGDHRRAPYVAGNFTDTGKHPWTGTGYIPCDHCAPLARADFPKFVCEQIKPNRLCKTPFPHGDGEELAKELSL